MRRRRPFLSRIWPLLLLLLLPALLAIGSAATAQEVTPSGRVRSSVVVRAEPTGTEATPLAALRPGNRAALLRDLPNFYQVRLPNGVEGFVSKRWTDLIAPLAPAVGQLVIHFLDVGQGDGTLVLCPNGANMLIDAGSTSGKSAEVVRSYVLGQIAGRGNDIDYLFVSHPDADHYNLIQPVLEGIAVRQAYFVGQRQDYNDEDMFDWLSEQPTASVLLTANQFDPEATPNGQIDCGEAKVWILAAAVNHPESRKNAMSIVLMIRIGDFEAVITGDATHATEDTILSRFSPTFLDVDLLRVGHHGSLATSTSKEWAEALSPTIAVVSAAASNNYGHPRIEVIDRITPFTPAAATHRFRYARANPSGHPKYLFVDEAAYREAVYATAASKTIIVTSGGTGFTVSLDH